MTLTQMRVLKNRVLVLLPPTAEERSATSGLFLAAALPTATSYGRVLKTGPDCRDVRTGDLVAFSPEAGDPLPLNDTTDALFVRETEIAAVIRGKEQKTA